MSDIARLKEATSMLRLFEAFGDRPKKGGGDYYYVLCPGHHDKVADDCFFKEGQHFAYCAACGKSFDPIDIIMLKRGCDFKEAADALWRLNGCPGWYKAEKKKGKGSFFISNSDLAFLGIRIGRCRLPRGEAERRLFSQGEVSSGVITPEGGRYLIYGTAKTERWETYLAGSRAKALIRKGCLKKEAELEALEGMLPGFGDTEVCREQRKRLDRIRRCANG